MSRERLRDARRLVVKVGTSAVSDPRGKLDAAKVARIADEVAAVASLSREVVLVSSGAIAAGLSPLGFSRRPQDLPTLQACAAVGQSHLMHAYTTAFDARGHVCAQVLLTRQDMIHRQQYVNALNTFRRLLSLGAIPVVNENDTIATSEIGFGENDLLAALVAQLVRADALVLLSDVDGLHEAGAAGRGLGPLVPEVEAITPEVEALAVGKGSTLSSGGMRSKLDATRIATRSGCAVVIARLRRGVMHAVLEGRATGTFFRPQRSRLTSRKAWIAFATMSRGRLVVDQGARQAVTTGKSSLLVAGIRAVEGTFAPGDAVEVADLTGAVFARGLVSFSSPELEGLIAAAGNGQRERFPREAIHRDELVVL